MIVRVELSLDIDPDAWTENYGVEGPAAIRMDVKSHVRNSVLAHLDELELLV